MRCCVLAVLFLAVAVGWGQPLQGPFTVAEFPDGAPVNHPRVVMRGDTAATVFLSIHDTLFSAPIAAAMDWTADTLSPLTFAPGWPLEICDLASHGPEWTGLIYGSQNGLNRTWLLSGGRYVESVNQIDEGANPSGIPGGSSSVNVSPRLSPLATGGYWLSWIDEWTQDFGPWSCGGSSLFALEITSIDTIGWPVVGEQINISGGNLALAALGPDTLVTVLGEGGTFTGIIYAIRRDGGWVAEAMASLCCYGRPRELLLNPNGGGILLTSGTETRLWGFEGAQECTTLFSSPAPPLESVVHSAYGIAWLSGGPTERYLIRANTNGVVSLSPGLVAQPAPGYRITGADITAADSGVLVVLWIETGLADGSGSRLRMVTLGWDTPLNSREPMATHPPSSFSLAAYPNPFNSALRLRYELSAPQPVTLAVYNLLGQEVARLHDDLQTAGSHEALWQPTGATGIYLVRLTAGSESRMQKVVYLK